ncbi:MAG TPA: 2-C-methyl-D-erythritol 4-phosphate cytidylyltransferase [Gemmatimonadaceae bacterium]|nr:2-C-methyl-D-erythritol 4-phosphate cytidylyltransferase [Gemmatimonadaceae bacterium]
MTDTVQDVGVVIVAGGTGTRTGSNELKQFRWVAGKPMLLHSVQLFQQRADVCMVVAVIPKAYAGDPPPWLFQSDLSRLLIGVGGNQRGNSVRSGLDDLPAEARIVVIHDAARPLVLDATIDAVIAAARNGTGAIAALPEIDTLKRVDADGRIIQTVERDGLWRAQTPQAFPREMIDDVTRRANREGISGTDDAALCEHYGYPVVVIRGSERAMKITTEADFARAEALSMLTE